MPDAGKPKNIESPTFSRVENGYSVKEVDDFVKDVAAEMRSLLANATPIPSSSPYGSGYEIAALIQHAHEAALRIKQDGESEAARMIQDAQRISKRAREEAHDMRKRAEKEVSIVRDRAYSAVERDQRQAEKTRQLAVAERSLAEHEARQDASRILNKAKQRSQEILSDAGSDAVKRSVEAERRLRRLQEAEVVMLRKIDAVRAQLEGLSAHPEQTATSTPASPKKVSPPT
jgi:cell division septum initiation protein DivIVA